MVYWPPTPAGATQVPAPLSQTVTAADVIVSDWVITFVDDANKAVMVVPTTLNPVVQNQGPA